MFNFDLAAFIQTIGYLGLSTVVFAESGLFFGFFLPGDSLLFLSGFLASQNYFDIRILIPILIAAAVLGDSVGYAFGKRVGPRIFYREESRWFHPKHIETTREFYRKHGNKTIVLARFLPIVRTFAPILAGVGGMPYRTFLFYNIIGGVLWAGGLLALGYYLGALVPHADRYIIFIIFGIVFISTLPNIVHILKRLRPR